MTTHISPHTRAAFSFPLPLPLQQPQQQQKLIHFKTSWRIKVSKGSESYLDMWRKAVERERLAIKFQHIKTSSDDVDDQQQNQVLEKKRSSEFEKILQVPSEERDRVQRMQVIDRAAAAIAAARALLNQTSLENNTTSEDSLGIHDAAQFGHDLGGIHG